MSQADADAEPTISKMSDLSLSNDTDAERKCIVIMGTTGTGKSTLGNALLGLSVYNSDMQQMGNRFEMSAGAKGCTLWCSSRDGFFRGDPTRRVRIIDTPGHGDGSGHDEQLREEIVRAMKSEKEVHAFVWAKNAQDPRVDQQDMEFLRIFRRIFGGGFTKNMVIVFTRFEQSEKAEKKRRKTGASWEKVVTGFRKAIQDLTSDVPMVPIDACYDEDDELATSLFEAGCEGLWGAVQEFAATPVEHIENVKDKISALTSKLKDMEAVLEAEKATFAEEREKMERDFEEMQRCRKAELLKIEEERMAKEAEFYALLEEAGETRRQDVERMWQEFEAREEEKRRCLEEMEAERRQQIEDLKKLHKEREEKYRRDMEENEREQETLREKLKEPCWLGRLLDGVGGVFVESFKCMAKGIATVAAMPGAVAINAVGGISQIYTDEDNVVSRVQATFNKAAKKFYRW